MSMSDADMPEPETPELDASSDSSEERIAAAEADALAAIAGKIPDEPERTGKPGRSGAFLGVPIEVTISVGKARPLVSELVELRRDSVLPLNSSVDDPVELYVGDKLIARGELQELGDSSGRLGVRLTEVADISNEL